MTLDSRDLVEGAQTIARVPKPVVAIGPSREFATPLTLD